MHDINFVVEGIVFYVVFSCHVYVNDDDSTVGFLKKWLMFNQNEVV